MARDWSKFKAKQQANAARRAEVDLARSLAEDEPRPSKAELRALGIALLADYQRPIRVLPSIIELKCGCGHRGRVKVYRGERKRFRCSKCGYLSM